MYIKTAESCTARAPHCSVGETGIKRGRHVAGAQVNAPAVDYAKQTKLFLCADA